MSKPADAEILPLYNWVYHLMRVLFGGFFRIGGLRVHGVENVPRDGPVILAPNHASMLDPPLVGVVAPRLVTTMGKSELFQHRVLGLKLLPYIIQRMGTFPVKRGAPDRRALRRAIQVLNDGGALVIFPEGTRTPDGELGPPELGLAMIAHAAKAPIVPMYLKGTEQAVSKQRKGVRLVKTEVWFGAPLRFEAEYGRKADRAALQGIGEAVMRGIAALRDAAAEPGPRTP